MDTTKSRAVRVKMEPWMHDHLVELGREQDVSVAHVIRRAIHWYLSNGNLINLPKESDNGADR